MGLCNPSISTIKLNKIKNNYGKLIQEIGVEKSMLIKPL